MIHRLVTPTHTHLRLSHCAWVTLIVLLFTASGGCHRVASDPDPETAEAARDPRPEDFRLLGWATVGPGTTGGAGGKTVTVSRPEDLVRLLDDPEPLIILVEGTLDFSQPFPGRKSNGRYYIPSNKTIQGIGADARIHRGEFRLSNVKNVIIRNLTFTEAPDTAIAITHGSTHVWIDHNHFSGAGDGLIDITRGADLITISWNRFAQHDKVSLVGASDGLEEDRGHLRVTYHHNWFSGTNQRHPRVRYGQVHLFNNLYDQVNVGIGIGVEAQIVSNGNFFANAQRPYHYHDTQAQPGHMNDSRSNFNRDNLPPLKPLPNTWSPKDHYIFTVHEAAKVPEIVRGGAGVGIINEPTEKNRIQKTSHK